MALPETNSSFTPLGDSADGSHLGPLLHRSSKKTQTAIIFGHADADGFLATEQSRANLRAAGIKIERIVVSQETRNHRFWHTTLKHADLKGFDLVAIVDIAFSFREPRASLDALAEKARAHPEKQFVVIDHHSLLQPREEVQNLTLVEVESAYDCCIGKPSDELMTLAALCEGEARARKVATDLQIKRALGVRRAAADVHGVAKAELLAMLKARKWSFFELLGEEPAHLHQTVRGRRTKASLPSPTLQSAIPLGLIDSRRQLAR